uniref:CARD domain-containing protein n=1 Tax=Branchiostoma floridae TaxID=7739 RepID=C3YHT7_BRAFL|eukprot:XP_002604063.1 hypothetical protein BRAFLDRAFT_71647 [Branchiostoma floridae]
MVTSQFDRSVGTFRCHFSRDFPHVTSADLDLVGYKEGRSCDACSHWTFGSERYPYGLKDISDLPLIPTTILYLQVTSADLDLVGYKEGRSCDACSHWTFGSERCPCGLKGISDLPLIPTTILYLQATMDPQDFLRAAADGDVEKVRRGLEAGLDVNTRDTETWTETRKQAEYSELVSSVGSEEGTTVKLFLCGDGQVGKTSLRVILKKTGLIVGALWKIRRKFRRQDVFNPTPGVHVSSKTVRGIGRLSLHDFAGQAQFYVTHAMLLRTTNAIFPVVYKIIDGEEEQKRQIHGWLSFIHCSNADPTNKPRIVLIASHADKLQGHEAGRRQATALVEHYRKLFQESLIVSSEVFLINCLEAGSAEIQRLREVLAAYRDDILKQRPRVPKVCVQLSETIEGWREERKTFPVMGWQNYLKTVRQASSENLQERIVQLASSYLHDEGEIIYLHREADSSVVLDPQWLFTSIFGHLLAPDNFPIVKIARTVEDYVTLEELTRVFSAVADIPLLIKLLQDFQLCHTNNGRTFILPSLLHQEMEQSVWSQDSHVSSKAVYFGLQIRGRTEIDSFSCDLFPRLQTLLMQADKLSWPLLWKNSAKCTDGKAEALLQITQDKRHFNIFVRSNDGSREDCNSIMDLLKDMTYHLLHETSPGARSRDMVLSALDLREHRPQPHAYSREEVEGAVAKGENVVHPKRNVPEKVKDLLLHLKHIEMDKSMLGRVARKRPELVETLRHINPILDHLRADDVINLDQNDRIRAARTPQDAARELLDILEAKGERACVKFHSVLKICDKFAASLIVWEEMS